MDTVLKAIKTETPFVSRRYHKNNEVFSPEDIQHNGLKLEKIKVLATSTQYEVNNLIKFYSETLKYEDSLELTVSASEWWAQSSNPLKRKD